MKLPFSALVLTVFAVGLLAFPLAASAGHDADPHTNNIHPLGHIVEPASLLNPAVGNPDIHTDIAFWGKLAIQGNWDGFNIRDISSPGNPKQISRTFCDGNQGDIVVWENIVVRSWNSNASGTTFCDGELVPAGFEGLHVFDISDLSDPVLVASVDLACGSHTATGVPDLANDRLLVYNSPSDAACPGIDIVEVPLDDPSSSSFLRFEPAGRPCHDTGVILGDAMLAACAGGDGFTVWTLDPENLEVPTLLYTKNVNADPAVGIDPSSPVTIGHSAGFTWDGEVLIFGHEPGGGLQARCKETDPDSDKSAFFFASQTGDFLGRWTLPRPQTAEENCTIHNYNTVPLRSGKYILVSGNYQSGTSVVDFTDPANAVELGWSDPPPIVPTDLGGAWSSYWYNGFIQETNITEGLNIFRFSGRETAGAMRLDHLNPQTQEFTIG
jgi:hypothetical protein